MKIITKNEFHEWFPICVIRCHSCYLFLFSILPIFQYVAILAG